MLSLLGTGRLDVASSSLYSFFAGLIDVGLTTDTAQPSIDLSDPEQTVDAYYRGLRTGDQAMVEKTLLHPRQTAPFDGGALHNYEILSVLGIISTVLDHARPGDVEIVARAEVRWPTRGTGAVLTRFIFARSTPSGRSCLIRQRSSRPFFDSRLAGRPAIFKDPRIEIIQRGLRRVPRGARDSAARTGAPPAESHAEIGPPQ